MDDLLRGLYYLTYTSGTHVEVRGAATIGELASADGATVWPPPGATEPAARCCELWAPEFHLLDGPDGRRWYLYYASDDGNLLDYRINVLEGTGDTPLGPYVYKGQLDTSGFAIDPTVFASGGRLYALWPGSGQSTLSVEDLYIARLLNPWTVETAPVMVSRPTAYCELAGPIEEGPEVLVHAGALNSSSRRRAARRTSTRSAG